MTDDPGDSIARITADRTHGAAWLSRKAVRVLAAIVQQSKGESTSAVMEELRRSAALLKAARPDMVSIAHYIASFQQQMERYQAGSRSPQEIKDRAGEIARQLTERSLKAGRRAAAQGALLITDTSTVITCSYSSTVCEAFLTAHRQEKNFRSIVAASCSRGISYGEATAAYLNKHGIRAEVIQDSEIERYTAMATLAMTGADRIFKDGSAVNGSPSAALAKAADEAGKPFYVVCETAKLDPVNSSEEVQLAESGFDIIPASRISGIITESGNIAPREIDVLAARQAQIAPFFEKGYNN